MDEKPSSYSNYAASLEKSVSRSEKKKSPFDKVGLLTKLGGNVKNWLERGFALRSEYKLLHYFRSAKDFKLYASDPQKNSNKIAGTINLLNARLFLATYISFPNCMEITTAPPEQRHFYMYAKTAQEMRSWIMHLVGTGVTLAAPSSALITEEMKVIPPPPAPQPVYGMQGTIEKRGEINQSFQARFFRIEEVDGAQTLAYYNRFDDTKPKGTIPLVNSPSWRPFSLLLQMTLMIANGVWRLHPDFLYFVQGLFVKSSYG